MGKKKSTRGKRNPDTDMVHFRPGAELGALIGRFAKEFSISRGEVAKRFTALTIRGFDLGFYPLAEELMLYLYGGSTFDEACHQLHVAVVQDFGKASDVFEIPREEKLSTVETVVEQYRSMRELEDETEHKKTKIQVYLE